MEACAPWRSPGGARQVARKQMYRATVVQKVGTLRVLDNREVTLEERERVDCLFGLDSRAAGPRP